MSPDKFSLMVSFEDPRIVDLSLYLYLGSFYRMEDCSVWYRVLYLTAVLLE